MNKLTAALSFKSIKDLDKSYSAFFNNMTVGYECEIAVGELESGYEANEIDIETERAEFEENFSWSKDDYLWRLSRDNLPTEVLEKFDIEPVYGYPNQGKVAEVQKILATISKNGYRVVGLPMLNQDPIMEEPSINNYTTFLRTGAEEFSTRDTRLVNLQLALTKAREAFALISRVIDLCPIYDNEIGFINNITQAQVFMHSSIKNLESTTVKSDETLLRRSIYYMGHYINSYVKSWHVLYQIIKQSTLTTYVAVLNEDNEIIVIDTTKYNDVRGITSPALKWSDDGKEFFEEDYNDERQTEENTQWESHLSDASDSNEDTKESVIKSIHRCVVEDVDSLAKYAEGYHGSDAQKYKGKYTVVESDSSIKPAGAEVVSLVFEGIKPSLIWLDKVFDMIEERGMETNKSTGLHVNIGTFRSISRTEEEEATLGNPLYSEHPVIDVLKLAVLSGDHYLLEQFGRLGNDYAKSLASNIRDLATYNFDLKVASKGDLFGLLRELNKTFIRNQTVGEAARYRSINMQHLLDKGYLEFRIAGGQNYHADKLKVRKAIYRYAQLCAIACDPKAYFKEYVIELYKRFVDGSGPPKAIDTNAEPRPKNAFEALYYLRAWNNKYHLGKERILLKFNTLFQNDVEYKEEIDLITDIDYLLGILSLMNQFEYKYVDSNVLYSFRLVMIKMVDLYRNSPKQYLSNFYRQKEEYIKNAMAPKLYRLKRSWVKYIFTGTVTQEITAMNKADRDKASVEANKFKQELRSKGKYSDRDIDGILGAYLGSRGEGKNDSQAREEALSSINVTASMKSKRQHNIKTGEDKQTKDFDAFYKAIKADPKIKAAVRPENWEWDIFADCYFTARLAGQSDKSAQRFAKAMFWDYVNNGRKDGIKDVQLKALYKKYTGKSDLNFKKRSAAYAKMKKKEGGDNEEYIDWDTWEKDMNKKEKELNNTVEASDQTYTNKTDKVKLLYYANRSTPQTCKPGATVTAKKGYGKRTSIKTATPEQVKQLKAGKWVRTRESGHEANEKGAKQSKYRPALAKKSREARKRKMAASDTPTNKYRVFIEEVLGK